MSGMWLVAMAVAGLGMAGVARADAPGSRRQLAGAAASGAGTAGIEAAKGDRHPAGGDADAREFDRGNTRGRG